MDSIDLSKPVKLKYPQKGEEKLIYRVSNYNEVTQRCYIDCVNSGLSITPSELVSIDDIENI